LNDLFAGSSNKANAARASVWLFAGYSASSLLRLGSNLILTRLLVPEAFGLMSLVLAYVQGLVMFSDVGIQPSIVQSPRGNERDFLNTAWTIQGARGIALWIVSIAGAYPFAIAYGQPQLAWLIPVAGCTALIAGFNSTNLATMQRQVNLKALTICSLVCQITGILIMILGAAATRSIWSIVMGMLGVSVCRLVLSHTYLGDFRNRLAWNPESAKALLTFGKWIFVSTAFTFLVRQTDRLLFGQIVSVAMLGVYSVALALASIPQQLVDQFGRAVAFPNYSRLYRDLGTLRGAFERMRRPVVVVGAAITSLLAIIAVPLVELLYDARYVEAGWMLQLLAVGIWFRILESHCGNALLAMGRSRVMAFSSAAKLAGMIVLIPVGYHLHGFPGAVAAYAVSECLRYAVSALAVSRHGLRVWKGDFWLTILAAATVTIGLLIQDLTPFASSTASTNIAACGVFVSAIWLTPVLMTIRGEVQLKK
jgi:O-antigen/teichoic acid export membrane protein